MVAILDYGMGNIHSVQKALQLHGAQTLVTNKPEDIKACDKVVLPGVGAFDDAMSELKKQNLISALKEHIKSQKTFLGICLGMQLLFAESEEAKGAGGLNILKGSIKRLENKNGLKVPHMGWNQLKIVSKCQSVKVSKECPLLKNIADNAFVYFCHSYYPQPDNQEVIVATTDYGINFASVVWQDNIYGVQFHPEKSQRVGLRILKNFVEIK